ncbi:hypothetical protein KFU94_35835 [Chloroflexi bacterium TSY]|nr:hypothetical protein [Chloroflexi bacterium TSY]
MAEFFIAHPFRRKNVGINAARQIFDRLRGTWHVAEMQTNTPAQRFWRRLIRDYTHDDFVETWSHAAPTGPKQVFCNVIN